MFTEHDPASSAQVPPGVKLTVPVGVDVVPDAVSAIVAEQLRETPTVPVAGQLTVVEVVRKLTFRPKVSKLPACAESELYVPVML